MLKVFEEVAHHAVDAGRDLSKHARCGLILLQTIHLPHFTVWAIQIDAPRRPSQLRLTRELRRLLATDLLYPRLRLVRTAPLCVILPLLDPLHVALRLLLLLPFEFPLLLLDGRADLAHLLLLLLLHQIGEATLVFLLVHLVQQHLVLGGVDGEDDLRDGSAEVVVQLLALRSLHDGLDVVLVGFDQVAQDGTFDSRLHLVAEVFPRDVHLVLEHLLGLVPRRVVVSPAVILEFPGFLDVARHLD